MLVASLFLRYYAAIDAKKERTSKHAQSFGTKNASQKTTPNQVQNITPTHSVSAPLTLSVTHSSSLKHICQSLNISTLPFLHMPSSLCIISLLFPSPFSHPSLHFSNRTGRCGFPSYTPCPSASRPPSWRSPSPGRAAMTTPAL